MEIKTPYTAPSAELVALDLEVYCTSNPQGGSSEDVEYIEIG